MMKIQQASLGFVSVLVAATLVGFDPSSANACSGSGSSSSGLSHGSKIGSGSVTVCVRSSSSTASTTTTKTITKTVTIPAATKPKPKPVAKPVTKPVAKPVAKPKPKPVIKPVSCPSASQLARVPRSPDAAERWVQSICSAKPKPAIVSKPAQKPVAKPKTITITETIVIEIPGQRSSSVDAVEFRPNQLVASVFPSNNLSIGAVASFSSNPTSHFGSAKVLGRQAEVHFVPKSSGWRFSDGIRVIGVDTERSFNSAGEYQVQSWVEYLVSYRVLGQSAWKPVSGSLVIQSNSLKITVVDEVLEQVEGTRRALLVGANCLGQQQTPGCDT